MFQTENVDVSMIYHVIGYLQLSSLYNSNSSSPCQFVMNINIRNRPYQSIKFPPFHFLVLLSEHFSTFKMPIQFVRNYQEKIDRRIYRQFDFDDQRHYDVLYFEKRYDFQLFKKKVEETNVDHRRSTWYGDMADAVSILNVGLVNRINEHLCNRESEVTQKSQFEKPEHHFGGYKHPIIFVAPVQLTKSHIIGTFEEYTQALNDLENYLENESLNIFKDGYNEAFSVYISVRLTQLDDKIIRMLFLHELLETVISAVEDLDYNTELPDASRYIKIGMFTKDAQQTGLETLPFRSNRAHENGENFTDSAELFSNIQTTLEDLRNYHSQLYQIGPLIIDAAIFANDNNLLGAENNRRLQFLPDQLTAICEDRSIDPNKLKCALRSCDRNNHEVKQIMETHLESAVSHLIFMFNAFGVGFELPVKYIRSKNMLRSTRHLYKLSRNEQDKKKISKKICTLQTYDRRVKSTDDNGFRVQTFSSTYWLMLTIAVGATIAYVLRRNRKVRVEDIIQTVVALLTVIITTLTTLILNTKYKGEKLGDILTNIRDIDTQDEFDMKVWRQTSDIIEVLRMSHKAPMFLGGSENTSFTPKLFANAGLQPEHPIAFSNLEAIGYGLYETAEGKLYMIDQWKKIYRAYVIDNEKDYLEYDKFETKRETKYLPALQENSPTLSPAQSSGTERRRDAEGREIAIDVFHGRDRIRRSNAPDTNMDGEQLKRLTLYFTYLDAKIDKDFSTDPEKSGDPEHPCCMRVNLSNAQHNERIFLSRVLPYQARERAVGTMRRYYRLTVSREIIHNRDLYRMDVGVRKGPKKRPGRVPYENNAGRTWSMALPWMM